MAINTGTVSNHKFYDEMGRITPNVDWSESHHPHFEAQVASWLPVVRFETELKAWFVASAGKVVSVDREKSVVLSGYKKKFAPGATTALVYTSNDYAAGTVDLTTGAAYATNGTTTYSEATITAALRERGLITMSERAMDFISAPIGYASYNYYQAAGRDARNPATYTYYNFKAQELVAVTCDYVILAPVTPAAEATETMDTDNTGGATTALTTAGFGTGGWYNAEQINDIGRYASVVAATDNIVCYVFEKYPIAKNTDSTPITCSVTGALTTEKTSISAVTAAGDYYIDYAVGALFLYEAGGDAIPTGLSTSSTITYYHYESEVEAARVSSFFCATGDIKPGDFVTYDSNSNLIKADLDFSAAMGYDGSGNAFSADPDYSGTDATISLQLEQGIEHYVTGIIGQVLNEVVFPKDYLDRVRTAFAGGVSSPNTVTGLSSTAVMQTPGSATGGRPDFLTYTNSAEKALIVNFIHR